MVINSNKYKFDRKDVLIILAIFSLGIILRIMYFNDYRNTNVYPLLPYSDSYSYFLWAKDIASGDLWGAEAFMKWPLYAYFLGFCFKVFGANLLLIYTLQFIFGTVNCILIYTITRIIFNQKVAFIAALFCIWYGLFIFYDSLLIYTSLSLLLNSLLFLFILYIKDNPNKKNLFWAGVLLGVSTLTQANIAIFGILAVIWILKAKKPSWHTLFYNFSCFMFGLCIVIGAVTLRNYLVEKDFVLISGQAGFNFYSGNNRDARGTFSCPSNVTLNQSDMFRDSKIIAREKMGRDLKTSEVSSFWFSKAIEFIRENPSSYSKLLFRKLTYILSPKEFVHDAEYYFILDKVKIFKFMFMDLRFILPLGLLGMVLGLKRFKEAALLYIFLITIALSISLFFVTARYRIAIVPFFSAFSALGIFNIWNALRDKSYLRFGLLCAAVVTFHVLLNYDAIFAKNFRDNSVSSSSIFDYHLMRASLYETNLDYQNAIRELNLAHNIEPDNRRAIFRLGIVYFQMRDFKVAEEKFRRVIEVCPLCVDAYYNLGFLYNQQQRFDEAKEMLEKTVSLDPENLGAHFELGVLYKAQGDTEKAKKEFSFALRNINRWRTEERAFIEKELRGL